MILRWRRLHSLPLTVWAGGGVALAVALAIAIVAVTLAFTGDLDRAALNALGYALLVAPVAGCLAAMAARRFAEALRGLRDDAVHRLQDPTAPLRSPSIDSAITRSSSELVELARTLDALHLRVRVADEVAERHRRTAETSSA